MVQNDDEGRCKREGIGAERAKKFPEASLAMGRPDDFMNGVQMSV